MSVLDSMLAELARMRSGDEPIVSLYLDIRWGDEQQRERVRLFVQDRIRKTLAQYPEGSPGREGLARTLQRVQQHTAGLTSQEHEPGKNGVALFADEALGLWRPYFFRRSFQNELCTDHIPHLAQLARFADDHEPALVVVPDSGGADIYQVLLGDLAAEESLRGFVPRRENDEFNPGAALHGRHFERVEKDLRHADSFVQRNRRRAAEEAAALFDRVPGTHVVLVGTNENLAAFERELPERVRAAVIARIPRPREWESGDGARRDGVVAGAAAAVRDHERSTEERVVEEVVGQSLRGGQAVLGPEDVVMALNEHRVHRLVLEEDFSRAGWRCTNCDALGPDAEAEEVCPYCGGSLVAVHYLGEALVARTLGEGGEVEVVAHTNKLHSYRSVGAFLRQASANGGNRGASGSVRQ
jgi:peptide subunit release factor 1 (eRF1)